MKQLTSEEALEVQYQIWKVLDDERSMVWMSLEERNLLLRAWVKIATLVGGKLEVLADEEFVEEARKA